jgi:hypothetical protein
VGSAVSGGAVSATTVIGGVTLKRGAILESGFEVQAGGAVDLAPGALVTGLSIDRGAMVSGAGTLKGDVFDDGVLDGAVYGGDGGYLQVDGMISGVTIGAGALAYVDGGAALDAAVRSGGVLSVTGGGTASGTVISKGGAAGVFGGGVADLGVVLRGGTLTVSSGGTITGGFTLSGGLATLDPGAVDTGAVVGFAGSGGELAIASGGGFGGVISGLGAGDKLDLGGFAYNASHGVESVAFLEAAGGLSGTLTLSSGGGTEALTLLGAYATSNFALSTDKHGGTFVSWVSRGGFALGAPPDVRQLAAAIAAFTGAAPGAALPLAATSAAHAPLLTQGR